MHAEVPTDGERRLRRGRKPAMAGGRLPGDDDDDDGARRVRVLPWMTGVSTELRLEEEGQVSWKWRY